MIVVIGNDWCELMRNFLSSIFPEMICSSFRILRMSKSFRFGCIFLGLSVDPRLSFAANLEGH